MPWVKMPFQDQWSNTLDENAAGFVVKTYVAGTTTATPMAIDKNGTTTVSTVTLNADGLPEVSGNEVTLYIDREFKYAVFENATDAAANSNPYYGFIDNVPIISSDFVYTKVSDALNDATLASLIASGGYIETRGYYAAYDEGGNIYKVVASGTGTDDGGLYLDDTIDGSTFQLLGQFPGNIITAEQFGAQDTPTDATTAINNALAAANTLDLELVMLSRAEYYITNTINVPGTCSLSCNRSPRTKLKYYANVVGCILTFPVAKILNRITFEMDSSVSTQNTACIEVGSASVKANSCVIQANILEWGDMTARTGDGIRVVNGNFTEIDDVLMENIGRDGLHVETLGGNTNSGIINSCYVNKCGRDGYFIEDDVADWRSDKADVIDFGRFGYHYFDNVRFCKLNGDVESVGSQSGATGVTTNDAGYAIGATTVTLSGASGATTDATGYAAGATSVTLASAGTGSISVGDTIKFAGDVTSYTISVGDTDVSNGGSITFTPGLKKAIGTAATAITVDVFGSGSFSVNDVITFQGDSTFYTITSGDADVTNGGTITFTPALASAISASKTLITMEYAANGWVSGVYCGPGAYGNTAEVFPVSASGFADKLAKFSNVIYRRAGPNEWQSSFGVPIFNDGITINNFSDTGELCISQTDDRTYNLSMGGTSGVSQMNFTHSGSSASITTTTTMELIPNGRIVNPNSNADDLHIHAATGLNAGISILTANTEYGSIRFGDPQNDSAGNLLYDHPTNEMRFFCNDAASGKFDNSTTAGQTRFFLYDVDNGQLERVTVGAADSGGSGFKVLRIPN